VWIGAHVVERGLIGGTRRRVNEQVFTGAVTVIIQGQFTQSLRCCDQLNTARATRDTCSRARRSDLRRAA
jgi:hypothetical protein